jgi:hypothetical protein
MLPIYFELSGREKYPLPGKIRNMKKNNLLAALFILAAIVSGCKPAETELYVSLNGKTGNPGTQETPLPDIQAAIDEASRLKTGDPEMKIVIRVSPGEYHLNKPLVIPGELSNLSLIGTGSSEVTVKGSAILDLKWEKHEGSILVSPVANGLAFDQLAVNGKLQILARYPDYDENGGHLQGHAPDALSPERIKTWKNPAGTIFNVIHGYEWGDFHYVITGIDEQGQPILEGGHQNNRKAPPHPEYRMVENVFEELDSPGEWYLDTNTRLLYFWPGENTDLQSAVFEGVTLKNLLTIKGNEKSSVSRITISGIRFEYTRRTIMEPYEPLLRGDWTIYRGGALFIEGAVDCTVSDCEFTNLGGNAIFVSGYNRDISITGNHIHECGASGICFVGDPSAVRSPSFEYGQFVPLDQMDTVPGPANERYPKDCLTDNNLIYRTGRIEKQTAGVQIAMSMGITVSHNSIYEVPRAGININDGTWGGHILEFNDVFNTVLETGDHGSFNSWGRDRFWHPNRPVMDSLAEASPDMVYWDAIHTTVIRNNRFRCDHGWDIDLDDGSSNYHIYNNLCLNGGLKLREGLYRLVENNIMVNNSFHPHVWFRNSGDIFRRNIVSGKYRDIRLEGWGKELDFNLFPDEASLNLARSHGVDANSTFGDPLFKNPDTGDYSVQENSPALKLGFKNFQMDNFGVQKPELKKIAQSPELPQLTARSGDTAPGTITDWRGARVKNIETLGERSASGLSRVAGVLILSVAEGTDAHRSGLQNGDVILQANGKEVLVLQDLLKLTGEPNSGKQHELTVKRNQSEIRLQLVGRK